MARQDDVAAIVRNPEWFAYRYDPQHDAVQFIRADRNVHRAAAFLRDEYLPSSAAPLPLGREEAIATAPAAGRIHYIFHSAYCCSTLLARAFDAPGHAMGLKEPPILNDLVGWNLRGADRTRLAMVLDQSLTLLARPFTTGEATLIKPSNIVNGLIQAMLGLKPDSRALLLYAPLNVYLASIAKKGLWGRLWVRSLLLNLIKEGRIDLGFSPEQYVELSDLQVAAIGWIAQHAQFLDIVRRHPGRVATLNSETLLASPGESMIALDTLFGTGLGQEQVDRIVAGPAFMQNSKTFAKYGAAARDVENAASASAHRDELVQVEQWALEVARTRDVPLDLPSALLDA